MNFKRIYFFNLILIILFFTILPLCACASSSDYWFDEGNRLLENGSYKEAVEAYDRSLEKYPDSIDVLYNKGMALFNMSEYERSLSCFNRILEIIPYDEDTQKIKNEILSLMNNEVCSNSNTEADEDKTDKDIENFIKTQISYDEYSDWLKVYTEDIDSDGKNEFLVLPVVSKDDTLGKSYNTYFFILKNDNNTLKKIYYKEIGGSFENKEPLIQLIKNNNKLFLGCNLYMGGNCGSNKEIVHLINVSNGKIKTVWKRDAGATHETLEETDGTVWVTRASVKYYKPQLCSADQEWTKEYFKWNGEKFVYDYEEKL